MPKYIALVLLSTGKGYIQVGEEVDIDNPESEKILLESGFIKAATKKELQHLASVEAAEEKAEAKAEAALEAEAEVEAPKKLEHSSKNKIEETKDGTNS